VTELDYRGFNDGFTEYRIDDKLFQINSLSFKETQAVKKIAKKYEEVFQKFQKEEASDIERVEAQEEFIISILKKAVNKKDYEILTDNYSMPTLFGFARDYYSFLVTIGNSKELELLKLQTLSKSE
jgi:hypothetical protein